MLLDVDIFVNLFVLDQILDLVQRVNNSKFVLVLLGLGLASRCRGGLACEVAVDHA